MPKPKPIDLSEMVARITNTLGGWFGPAQAPAPMAQQSEGRQFDYPVAVNLQRRPRQAEQNTFEQLRALADNFDVLRMVIETRKDQICGLKWGIRPRNQELEADDSHFAATQFFLFPDKEHTWDEWLRMLLEDLFVIDAPCIYLRKTNGGELYAAEPVDGATIKRVIDERGRTPPPPNPAYQQVLKGTPTSDYTREQMIYKPRNLRTNKLYGFSPVEQIVLTVNIALRRQATILEYYQSGTVPDALAGVPEGWTQKQIETFQMYWDNIMEDTATKRKLKFVPGELAKNFVTTKQPPLKDMYDEWLARVTCYCFSIEPTPFVAQVNRSVAETSREQSLTEGLQPIKSWVKNVVDGILGLHMNMPDAEFYWDESFEIDPKTQAEINKTYIDAKVLHPDEVRFDLGREPLTPEQKEDMRPPAPIVVTEPGKKEPEVDDETKKVSFFEFPIGD